MKPAISSPLLLKGTLDQLENGMPAAIEQFIQTLQELTTDLQCNLDAIAAEAEKAKNKAATAASKRGKKAPAKTPFNGGTKAKAAASSSKATTETEAAPEPEAKPEPEVSVDDLF